MVMARSAVSREGEGEEEEEQGQNSPIPEETHCSKRQRITPTTSNPEKASEEGRASADENVVDSNYILRCCSDSSSDCDSDYEPDIEPGSASALLSDPNVLGCPTCRHPLSIPVFQCFNGHIACDLCCIALRNECASCFNPIGYDRCLAIEKFIEAVKIPCKYGKYGCRVLVSYFEKHDHERNCGFTRLSCPFPECIFEGKMLKHFDHMADEHYDSMVFFDIGSPVNISITPEDKVVVLEAQNEAMIFVLVVDRRLSVKSIQFEAEFIEFAYDLTVRSKNSSIRFQSIVERTTGKMDDSHSLDSLWVPDHFRTNGNLEVELYIRNCSPTSPCPDISKAVQDRVKSRH